MRVFIYLICVFLCGNSLSLAKEKFFPSPCLAVKIQLDNRIENSTGILYGKVMSQKVLWDDEKKSIYTLNELRVSDEWSKAHLHGSTVFLLTEGGDLGDMGRTVIGAMTLTIGDEGYFFIEKKRILDVSFSKQGVPDFHRIYSDIQGVLCPTRNDILKDCWGMTDIKAATFHMKLSNKYNHTSYKDNKSENQLNIDVEYDEVKLEKVNANITFEPKSVIGGKGESITIKGSGFGASRGNNYVIFTSDGSNYHAAEYARTFAYKKWTDNEIIVEVPPSYSNKVRVIIGAKQYESSDILRVTANIATRSVNPLVYTHLVNRDNKGGYTWVLDKQLFDNKEARECTESVMRQFRCKTGMSFTLRDQPTSAGYKMNDGVNSIVFDAPGYELPAGTVAYCDWVWFSCVLGNETFYYVPDFDCRLSTDFEWFYGKGKNPKFGMAKLRYVLFHEIGHALQLGHVNEDGESMHPVVQALPAENWLERDSITDSEQRAGTYVSQLGRNFTFQGCGIKKLLPPQNTDCNIDLLAVNILSSPRDTTVCIGSNAEFTVSAKSVPDNLTLEYQWFKDGQPIEDGILYRGVDSPSLIIQKVNESSKGVYSVEVSTNWAGVGKTKSISEGSRLDLNVSPKITYSPKEQLVTCHGNSIEFTTSVYGKDYTYELISAKGVSELSIIDSSSNADNLGDSTNISYSITFAQSEKRTKDFHDLEYKLVVKSSCGSDSSNIIKVRLYASDSIYQDLNPKTNVLSGDSLTLIVKAMGNELTYQWYKNLKMISGAMNPNLVIPNAKNTDNGQYYCIVSGTCNEDTSALTNVTVEGPSSTEVNMSIFSLEIHPNPLSDQLIITYSLPMISKANILITDITGRVIETIDLGILHEGSYRYNKLLDNYSQGMYSLILSNNQQTLVKQFAIIK